MLFLLIGVIAAISRSDAVVKIVRFDVPETVDPRTPAELLCEFEHTGDGLQSVKWRRNDQEFIYYRPEMTTPLMYSVGGIERVTAVCNFTQCRASIEVTPVPDHALYRCEVSGERPRFREVHSEKSMAVLALPEGPPKISGKPPRVEPDTDIFLNCSSGYALPPAQVLWFIDGEFMNGTDQGNIQKEGLFNSWSSIVLQVRHKQIKQVECRWRMNAYGRRPIERHSAVLLADEETSKLTIAHHSSQQLESSGWTISHSNIVLWVLLSTIVLRSF